MHVLMPVMHLLYSCDTSRQLGVEWRPIPVSKRLCIQPQAFLAAAAVLTGIPSFASSGKALKRWAAVARTYAIANPAVPQPE